MCLMQRRYVSCYPCRVERNCYLLQAMVDAAEVERHGIMSSPVAAVSMTDSDVVFRMV